MIVLGMTLTVVAALFAEVVNVKQEDQPRQVSKL